LAFIHLVLIIAVSVLLNIFKDIVRVFLEINDLVYVPKFKTGFLHSGRHCILHIFDTTVMPLRKEEDCFGNFNR